MFSSFNFDPILMRNIKAQAWSGPTPIQATAIPHALAGRDVVATAETGSGKTAAFVLPILQRLMKDRQRAVGALILCPTREIALQTEASARKLGRETGVRCVAIYGGVGLEPQVQALRSGVEIVVATPGRLLDHIGRGTIRLASLKMLVLDEADRMMDMGFLPDLRRILGHLPTERQTMLFSATMPPEIMALAESFTKEPARVSVGRISTPPATCAQKAFVVAPDAKTNLLLELLRGEKIESALVFTRTKHRANRLTRQLSREGINAACIHGDRSQKQREAALGGFRSGAHKVLVATDIASRGLDVQGVTHVINYDLPNMPEDYVHRIGRTARAGASGLAVSFITQDDYSALRQIEKTLGYRIRRVEQEIGATLES